MNIKNVRKHAEHAFASKNIIFQKGTKNLKSKSRF
jgi:hypothetical protein